MAIGAAVARRQTLSVVEYYRLPQVRRRIREYCGASDGSPMTCVYLSALTAESTASYLWDLAPQYPPDALDSLFDKGADVSRSAWDSKSVLFHLDIDYQNTDRPAEPFTRPAEVFFKLEPVYRATRSILRELDLPLFAIMTGRGYHFTGRISIDDPLIQHLANLPPDVPAWYASRQSRQPSWVAPPMDALRARAYAGVGMVIEYLAHLIVDRGAPTSSIPVVLNGTEVGTGLIGRECVSVDLSYAGDPLDIRHMRVAFGAYQYHRFRGDIVGESIASGVPPLVALPRAEESLFEMLEAGRHTARAAELAESKHAEIPLVTAGVSRLAANYEASSLARFHRSFYGTAPHPPAAWPDTYDRLKAASLLPCVAAPLARPNDLLLRPTHLQLLTRALMSQGWHPRHIAGLVHSRYAQDFGWGARWSRIDPETRADFDVRVFAGLIAAGVDQGIDFNCTSTQEKGLCPLGRCDHDLRQDRDRLLARVKP